MKLNSTNRNYLQTSAAFALELRWTLATVRVRSTAIRTLPVALPAFMYFGTAFPTSAGCLSRCERLNCVFADA